MKQYNVVILYRSYREITNQNPVQKLL